MPISRQKLVEFLDAALVPDQYGDYCPNGLQVEGCAVVGKLVTGVTACQALIDAAVAANADALLVHHGFFWRGENPTITGMKKRRVAALLQHDINLLAYHLPLDAHPEFGNNACLATLLDIQVEGSLNPADPSAVGNVGRFATPRLISEVVALIEARLDRKALLVGAANRTVQRVAWCTGAAQDYIGQAIAAGADLYITGEVSEQTVHIAREEGIAFIAAGHHATERYGVQALGEHLARELGLAHQFIDIDNPV
jgi:dinuclear metal center YbgI/SA1388 family protein